ncbi:hypothetical protein HK097_008961 [Rhizophlyctis rosea]|uniref:Uncharacterized protein n=1 Tax=Rhizophlyctis rosea TaxID=64517 RepID=A0AAD5SKV5_9FUNG|nr:hypothetical protein HK097_008961 [Rhizophlyctis rosea]
MTRIMACPITMLVAYFMELETRKYFWVRQKYGPLHTDSVEMDRDDDADEVLGDGDGGEDREGGCEEKRESARGVMASAVVEDAEVGEERREESAMRQNKERIYRHIETYSH